MGRYVQGLNVNQTSFLPLSFDEMIDEDNAVRGIDVIVDTLDKEKLNFTRGNPRFCVNLKIGSKMKI